MKPSFLKFLFRLFLLLLALPVKAQIIPHKKYTTKDGLIADRVTSITQDSSGMMWFGSHYGISQYDGQNFNTINLPLLQQQKYVTSLSNNNNVVYAGFLFNGGAIKYQKGKITPLLQDHPQNYGLNEVSVVYNGLHNKTWIVASNKLIVITENTPQQKFDFSIFKTTVRHLLEINENTIWAGTDNGVIILSKENATYTYSKVIYKDSNIFSLFKDGNNNIWVGSANTQNASIQFHDFRSDYTFIKTLYASPSIQLIKFSGNLNSGFWGIDDKGLFNINSDGKIFYYPSVVNVYTFTSCIFADRENNIWIANDPGVIKYSQKEVKTYFFDEPAAAGGHLIKTKNNGIVAANSKFLYQIKDNKIEKISEFRSKKDFHFLGFATELSNNQILISRWSSGFWKIKLKGPEITASSFIPSDINNLNFSSFTTDKQNNQWLCGINTLVKLKDGKIIENVSTKAFAPYLHITSIAVDEADSVIWLGENTTGIYKIKYNIKNGITTYQLDQHIKMTNGLTDPFIRSMLLDKDDNLWVGTRYGGVFQYIKSKDVFLQKKIENKNGNVCTRIISISEEPKKAIWFSSCNGVYRYLYKQNKWEHYNTSTGLPSAEVYSIAVDTAINTAWVLTSEGITALKYDHPRKNVTTPVANITAIYVLGQPDTGALYSANDISYSSEKNSIGFSFNSPSFLDEAKTVYSYKLEGYDNQWSEPTINNNVTYASLPPGKYTFKLKAGNKDGIWSSQPAVFSFNIIRPFYKETWFYILIVFITGILFYLIQIYRFKQKMQLQKLRLNIARDLHDDVGSALGSINLLTKTAHRKLKINHSAEEITGTLEKIGTSAQTTLEAMDDIIWSINPEKDTWQDLMVRMKEFAIPLTEARDIIFELNADAGDYDKLPMFLRRNIFLIFKEAITNSIKYSETTEIDVEIEIKNDNFYMQVKDYGKGFDINKKSNRNGIKNLKIRSEMVNGKIKISSIPNMGTTIKFYCPLR